MRLRDSFLLAAVLMPAPVLAQQAPPPATARTVDINEYFVEGNTTLSDPEIERAVYPFLGPAKTLDDIERARAALQKAYEDKGLKTVFVELPQQNVRGGRVVLAVVEARVGKVTVAGANHMSEERVKRSLASVETGTVPNLNAFSSELVEFNARSADRQVSPELSPGAEPGTIDVALTVEDKFPLHGSLEVNNQYSRNTTRTRVQGSLRYEDLWGAGHSIAAFYAVAPERPDDSEVILAAYGAPLSDRLRLDVQGLISNSDVAVVGATNVLGDGQSVTATLTRNLSGSGSLYHRVFVSLAWKDFKERVFYGDDIADAPITYFPVSLGYAGALRAGTSNVSFDAAATFAFRGLGSDSFDFDTKRFRATGGFAHLRAGMTVLTPLLAGSELFLSLNGQVASEPLISNEQFSAGGAGSVRGYMQSEAIGDDGYAVSAELRSPALSGLGKVLTEARLIGFVDGGKVWIKSPLPEQQGSFGLLGVGAGMRIRLLNLITGEVDLAWPVGPERSDNVRDPRVHFRLSADF